MNLFEAFNQILRGMILDSSQMTFENLMETKEKLEVFLPVAKEQLHESPVLSDACKAAIVKSYGYLDRGAVNAGLSIKKYAQQGERQLVARAAALLASLCFIVNLGDEARTHAESARSLDPNNTEAAELLLNMQD